MKKLLAFTIMFTIFFFSFGSGIANATSQLPYCAEEDSQNCYWDRDLQGNGTGSSFFDVEGDVTYTTPIEDHTCAPGFVIVAPRECGLPQTYKIEESKVVPTDDLVIQECTAGYALAEDGTCLPLGYWEDGTALVEKATDPEATAYVPLDYIAPVVEQAGTLPADLEAQAWALFDAVDAEVLLPETKWARVEFIGWNQVGFEPTENTITVWDNMGNHYLFQF